MEEHQFVFIGGLHRSGTTLLFQCLREHPQISGFRDTGVEEDEGQHLQTVYPTALTHGGAGKFGFNSETFLDESSQLASSENAQKLFQQWSQYWDLHKSILLEKSPPNLVRCRFLQKLFPNSKFIIVLRHPVAVSYATKKWSQTQMGSLIQHWLVCHDRFEADRPFLNQVLVLKYEDLIDNSSIILEEVYRFIGVEVIPATQAIRSGVNDRYFAWWNRRNNLIRSVYHQYLIRRFESRVNRFGYSLIDLEWRNTAQLRSPLTEKG
ncbi:MAG: sulfotransferase [Cyanobacteria bacterium J06592_8]